MGTERIVRGIVESYDSSDKLKKKIISRACRILENKRVEEFDAIYSFVSEFIEKYSGPYKEKIAIRLDDISLEDIVKPEHGKKISLSHIKTKLSKICFGFLLYLMKTNQLDLLGKPNTINNFNIEGKLEELLSDFEASGRLLRIPKRIFIKGINGEIEGSIGLGKRVYNGGSLKFFRHYGHIYAGMSRSKLYNVDPGLLATLSKEGLLDEAIPEYNKRSYGNAKRFLKNRTSYSDEEIKKMIRAYDMYGSAREASKHVPFGRRTIAKYVKLDRRGIKRGNPKKPYETMEIRDLFYRFNGKAVLAAQNSKYCYMTIRKYWSEAGLLLEKYKRV